MIGEHTDYNEGLVLPVAIDRALAIAGQRLNAPEVQCVSAHHRGYVRFPVPTGGIEVDQPGRSRGLPLWGRFVRAVLAEYMNQEVVSWQDFLAPSSATCQWVVG